MTLSAHFSHEEVTRSATASAKGIDNTVPLGYRYNVGRSAEMMEHVRSFLGGDPIAVTSWFSCDALNKAVGGSLTSRHPEGLAIDWKPTVLSLKNAFEDIAASLLPFDQLILEGTKDGAGWIHIGLSSRKSRRQVLRAEGDVLGGPMIFHHVRDLDN